MDVRRVTEVILVAAAGLLALAALRAPYWTWALLLVSVLAGVALQRRGRRPAGVTAEVREAAARLRAAGVEVDLQGRFPIVPVALRPLFAALVHEGADNVLRHTRAERCEIAIERDGEEVVVRVIDDGVARVVAPNPDATGIAALRERFTAAGGSVEATPLDPRGFQLSGRAPRQS